MPERFPPLPSRAFAAALAATVALPLVLPSALMATEAMILFLATLGCTFLIGRANILSFAQGAFFGIGAYVGALAMIHLGAGLIGAMLAGGLAAALAGALVGALCAGRHGFYLVMLTVAFAQVAYLAAYAASDWTGGENGLTRVPRPPLDLMGLAPLSLASPWAFYLFVAALALTVLALAKRVAASPFGTALAAIGENESRAAALGYDVTLFKGAAFTLSALVTGLAGSLYALFLNFVPLSAIDPAMSQTIVAISILGGTRSLSGALIGAVFYVVASNLLSALWPHWPLLLGVILIATIMLGRGGLADVGARLVRAAGKARTGR